MIVKVNVKKTIKLWKLLLFLKFPVVHLHPIMKEKIIQKAAEMYLTLGFKSVTMDDIANEMGISKKTIYTHFKNKTELVREATLNVFHEITCGIDHIIEMNMDPIQELYEIKKFAIIHLKNEKSSPQYQLQKYYPKIYLTVRELQFEKMLGCTSSNLNKGIEMGLYRKEINVPFISRLYFMGVINIKDDNFFPVDEFPKLQLMEDFLEYHLRGIITEKGLKKLNKYINN